MPTSLSQLVAAPPAMSLEPAVMRSILILGGTTEARLIAEALAGRRDLAVTLSLAGRTSTPLTMPVPVRTGGFGGAAGLARWLGDNRTDLLVDATHPFAARISRNAAEAAAVAGVAAFALRRPGWVREAGDDWIMVPDPAAAIAAIGPAPRRVFLALGRQEAHVAEAAPQHHYLVRSIDPVAPPLALPRLRTILARGPFRHADDLALLRDERIDVVLCKDSGGAASHAKISAARELRLPVVMVARPPAAGLPVVESVAAALASINHALAAMPRGA